MKVLIAGGEGQLGRALVASAPEGAEVTALGSAALDITDAASIGAAFSDAAPELLINAAAYTAVDRAENDAERAHMVNATAVGLLADAARKAGARFVHVSTDFVFDGTAGTPYPTDAPVNPLGVYGATKLAGEQAAGPDTLIVRTAWVYADTGGNFVRTMLRLMAAHPQVRVVADQIGTPTYAQTLATSIWALAGQGVAGTYHVTDSGVASWYDFAVAIQEEALGLGLLDTAVPVIPITTADFPTPARRPSFSVLDKSRTIAALGSPAPHWRDNLRTMLARIKADG